jgi:hypothetical protein
MRHTCDLEPFAKCFAQAQYVINMALGLTAFLTEFFNSFISNQNYLDSIT